MGIELKLIISKKLNLFSPLFIYLFIIQYNFFFMRDSLLKLTERKAEKHSEP